MTRQAQDVESYDRSTELEATGYKIITMAPALWRSLTRKGADGDGRHQKRNGACFRHC